MKSPEMSMNNRNILIYIRSFYTVQGISQSSMLKTASHEFHETKRLYVNSNCN